MRCGYLRPTNNAEKLQESIRMLNENGVSTRHIVVSSDFAEAVSRLHSGDTIVVYDIRDICRGINDFFAWAEQFCSSGIAFECIDEYALRIDPGDTKSLALLKTMWNLNRQLRAYHSRRGLMKAVENGKKLGRPAGITEKFKKAIEMYCTTETSVAEICRLYRCDPSTLYRHIRKMGLSRASGKPPVL